MARAISSSRSVNCSFANQSWAPVIERSQTSMIDRSATVTARYSGLSRFPLQTGHGRGVISRSISARMNSDSVSRWRRSRFGMMPSYDVSYQRRCPSLLKYFTRKGSPLLP